MAELAGRVAGLEVERREALERSAAAAGLLERTERDLAGHLAGRERDAAALQRAEADIAERRRDLSGRESEVRELRAALEPLREAVREAEMERTRAESDRRHLDDLCTGELGISATEAGTLAAAELEGVDLAALEAEVAELKTKIETLGPVNMMAIDEFTELEERHAFLSTQKADLEQSMDSLRESIRKINRQSRERFTEAFEAIRANYKEIFRVLFSGGRADLSLEEGEEDVLECGIEILAQPPGKRLGNVQLLSGGEKAMSAIALLFAIFRYQPSPFCLLDEVDAALDEANVGRFTRMLREYATDTQFILVTHNKLSMESANLLYGVTMEEPGVSRLVSLEVH